MSLNGKERLPTFDVSYTYKHTQPPDPEWKYGQGVANTPEAKAWMEGEKEGWTFIDADTTHPLKLYWLMNGGISPRPNAFVSSISADGVENLAPYSWFNMVTHDPPLVSIGCINGRKSARNEPNGPNRTKDTLNNIKATKGFTVNMISEAWIDAADICSMDTPPDVNEWPITGLTRAESKYVKPARVKESAFSMECELFQAVEIAHPVTGLNTCTMILGLVKAIHVRNDILTPDGTTVDPARYRVVASNGYIGYARVGEGFRQTRLLWAEEKEKIQAALEEKECAQTKEKEAVS